MYVCMCVWTRGHNNHNNNNNEQVNNEQVNNEQVNNEQQLPWTVVRSADTDRIIEQKQQALTAADTRTHAQDTHRYIHTRHKQTEINRQTADRNVERGQGGRHRDTDHRQTHTTDTQPFRLNNSSDSQTHTYIYTATDRDRLTGRQTDRHSH